MLANRLLKVAKDILGDYESYGVIPLLTEAKNVLAQRDARNVPYYNSEAEKVRLKATDIRNHYKARGYPTELREILSKSKYRTFLPENIAQLLLSGFPEDQTAALSSSELGLYLTGAENLRAELKTFVRSLEKLGISEFTIPDGLVSLDFLIPREVFENQLKGALEDFSIFERLLAAFIELTTGSAERPILIYASTTGFLVAVGVVGSAAFGMLKLYKLILDIIAQHLSIKKTIRDLAEFKPNGVTAFSEQADAVLQQKVDIAIEETLQGITVKTTKERMHELENTIRHDAIAISVPISHGARISISVESVDRMALLTEGLSEDSIEKFREDMAEISRLEAKVDVSLQQLNSAPLSKLGIELP